MQAAGQDHDRRQTWPAPEIGSYEELERILPADDASLLTPKDTQRAIFALKDYIEHGLCDALNLMPVTVPLIVDVESGVNDYLDMPYHQAVINGSIPLSIGGGIGQSRTYMLLLKKAHLGEVSSSVWPKILRDMCARKNIHLLR